MPIQTEAKPAALPAALRIRVVWISGRRLPLPFPQSPPAKSAQPKSVLPLPSSTKNIAKFYAMFSTTDMGKPFFGQNMQELFDDCKRGQTQRVQSWIAQKGKKQRSPLSFLRSNASSTPASGWLCGLRQPSTSHTLLHLAALHGHVEMARLLVQRDEQLARASDRKGCLPLHLAAWNGHLAVLEILIDTDPEGVNAVDNAKQTALHLATLNGHGQVVRLLLQRHADPRLRNANQECALDIAVRTGKACICRLLLLHCPDLPLQCASDCCPSSPLAKCPPPNFPLHSAARLGHLDCLEALLEHGFDVNYLDREGTALHAAVRQGQAEMARALLDKGIDAGIRNSEGKTALEMLEDRLEVAGKGQGIVAKWRECRKVLAEHEGGRRGEEQAGKEPNWKHLMPRAKEASLQRVPQKPSPPIPSPRSTLGRSNPFGQQNGQVSPRQRPSLSPPASPASAPATCVYQPLGDLRENGVAKENGGCQPPANYQNVPKGGLLYDNAPVGSVAQKKWQHNCANGHSSPTSHHKSATLQPTGTLLTISTPSKMPSPTRNGQIPGQIPGQFPLIPSHRGQKLDEFDQLRMSSQEFLGRDGHGLFQSPCSTLGRATASPPNSPWKGHGRGNAPLAWSEELTTSTSTTEPNSPERVAFSRDSSSSDQQRTTPQADQSIQCLAEPSCNSIATLALSCSSYSSSLPRISHFSPTPPAVPSPAKKASPPFPAAKPSLPPPQPLSVPGSKPLQQANNQQQQQNSLAQLPHTNCQLIEQAKRLEEERAMDEDICWKEIDDLLSSFQRESFYSPIQKQRFSSSPIKPLSIGLPKPANSLANGHSHANGHSMSPSSCSSLLIVIWLREEVGLEEEMATQIGQVLYGNGFDRVEFMKGALNTKLMAEMGIERKCQLRICRHFNEPGLAECIPNAEQFEFVSDWLNALQLLDHLGPFSKANLTSTADLIAANLSRGDLEKMRISQLGHLARIIRSLELATKSQRKMSQQRNNKKESNSLSTPNSLSSPQECREHSVVSAESHSKASSTASSSRAASLSPQVDIAELRVRLTEGFVRYTAHYLGASDISNVDGTEDCRRAMNVAKGKAGELRDVPHVLLEISVSGVNILDENEKALSHQPISHIQVVCQDELDLNCFAYIFKDGDRHFSHVFCVLTGLVAKEIIVTLGEAFNLAYKIALQQDSADHLNGKGL